MTEETDLKKALAEDTQQLTMIPVPTVYMSGEKPSVVLWHLFCKYTPWSEPFSSIKPGLGTLFGGGTNNSVWWQSRKCVVCNLTHHRRVELPKDR